MTNIWPLFVWSQPGQRMSRSPGLMGSIDVRLGERVTQFTRKGEAAEDERCDCCDIPLMSPEMCGPGWVVPVSHYHGHYDQSPQCSVQTYKGT